MPNGTSHYLRVVCLLAVWTLSFEGLHATEPPVTFCVDHPFADELPVRAELVKLHEDLQSDLQIPPLSTPVRIYIFQTAGAYRSFLSRVPGLGPTARTGLFLKRNGQLYIFTHRHEGMLETLRHEFTHAVLNDHHPGLPIWLDEGLAEFYEPRNGTGNQADYRRQLRRRPRLFWSPRLQRLSSWREMSDMGLREYAEAWSWVYLLQKHVPNGRPILIEYLTLLRQGQPVGNLADHLERLVRDPDERWEEIFRP